MAKTALQKSDSVKERCDKLLKFAEEVPEAATKNEVVRMVIFLAVAGFDAYFTEKFSDMLVPYIKKRGKTERLVELLERPGSGWRPPSNC